MRTPDWSAMRKSAEIMSASGASSARRSTFAPRISIAPDHANSASIRSYPRETAISAGKTSTVGRATCRNTASSSGNTPDERTRSSSAVVIRPDSGRGSWSATKRAPPRSARRWASITSLPIPSTRQAIVSQPAAKARSICRSTIREPANCRKGARRWPGAVNLSSVDNRATRKTLSENRRQGTKHNPTVRNTDLPALLAPFPAGHCRSDGPPHPVAPFIWHSTRTVLDHCAA